MPTPMAARQAPPAGRYAIDPTRSVTFVTRHMFGLARVRGTFAVRGGVLAIAEAAESSGAEAEVSAASFSDHRRDHCTRDQGLASPAACQPITGRQGE
jgi:polyisoprenoid-binding protein YceI